jgi:uridine kinase
VTRQQDETTRVADVIARRARDGFLLVGIDGTGGSGKSALASGLAGRLRGTRQVTVVHGDDFYRPMAASDRLLLSPSQGYEQYFDWQRLRDQVLVPLAGGTVARYQRYDWATGELGADDMAEVPRSGLVLVEGVYSARPELADYYDLTIWVEAPRALCLSRVRERGHDHGPGDWDARWRSAEEHYLAATGPATRLDLVVRGY